MKPLHWMGSYDDWRTTAPDEERPTQVEQQAERRRWSAYLADLRRKYEERQRETNQQGGGDDGSR